MLTGYAKVDGMWTDTSDGELPENNSARDFYVPGGTPVGGVSEGTDFDAHAKQTRINFGTDTILEGGDKLSTRFEVDFFGSITGDQRITNTYAPVLRHAYVQWREWLVGQTWIELPGRRRAAGCRRLHRPDRRHRVRASAAGALHEWRPVAVRGKPRNDHHARSAAAPAAMLASLPTTTRVPDLTARYTWKGDWGHFSVAGLARELKYETTGAGAIDANTWSMAGSLSGKFMIGKDDIRWMLLGGNLGRYVGLNFSNDVVLDGGGDLETIDGYAGFIAYRHVWSPKWRSNLYYALGDYDNEAGLTGGGVNKSSESWTFNTWYTPLPKLDIGAEFRHAVRELENGNDGSLDRLQFTTRYSF